jgi:uncharacterized protein (DUF2236 family)
VQPENISSRVGDVVLPDDDAAAVFAFAPDSMLWRVCRERCNLLDGGAAAVLQVAHPKIAAGVRDHSDFRRDTFGRLQRTLDGVNTIAFGTRAEAAAVAARIAARHRGVRGRVASQGLPATDECYAADDPELLMWVIATLVVAAIAGYERALPRLSNAERGSFYADMRRFGTYFGLPAGVGPQTWDQFERYYDGMIADERMGSGAVSRMVARAVAAPARPWWLRLLGPPARFAFVEVLPSPVRERLGFRRTLWTSTVMACVRRLLPWVVPILPARLRYVPQYLAARKRIARVGPEPH